jgi:TonB family protein
MIQTVAFVLLCLILALPVSGQATSASPKSDDGRAVYAIYAPKPLYPYKLKSRHVQGAGVFQMHIRADGTVGSVDTIQSTGNTDLDECARSAFTKWRFQVNRPTEVKIPITFSMRPR